VKTEKEKNGWNTGTGKSSFKTERDSIAWVFGKKGESLLEDGGKKRRIFKWRNTTTKEQKTGGNRWPDLWGG